MDLPKVPPLGLLMSMALQYDVALGVPRYYEFMQDGEHKTRLLYTLKLMVEVYAEVTGTGYYKAEFEEELVNQVRIALGDETFNRLSAQLNKSG